MDEPLDADATLAVETSDNPLVETTSREYLGRWNHLVSTTNWEKGHIICQWREALVAAGAAPVLVGRGVEPPRRRPDAATRRPAPSRMAEIQRGPGAVARALLESLPDCPGLV